MKCNKCRYSSTKYDTWLCAWTACCSFLGTAKVVSDYTEDEENVPEWDEDLGQANSYCQKSVRTMSDNEKGLYGKYIVHRNDLTPVYSCFVLEPDKDPAAVVALRAYAAATENKALAQDIYNWVGKE